VGPFSSWMGGERAHPAPMIDASVVGVSQGCDGAYVRASGQHY